MNSLDPRVNRLPFETSEPVLTAKVPLDQLTTFEVFVQPRDGKPFQHEGSLHAPDRELAFVLAKETFTRRFTCTSLFVAESRFVFVSPVTEGDVSVYSLISGTQTAQDGDARDPFEIFHLLKRGKQHIHAGRVHAWNYDDAFFQAQKTLHPETVVYNLWAIRTSDIRFTRPDEKDFWITLPDKKFRDASAYKAGDKLKDFLETQQHGKGTDRP